MNFGQDISFYFKWLLCMYSEPFDRPAQTLNGLGQFTRKVIERIGQAYVFDK